MDLLSLRDICNNDSAEVGGKARSLAMLQQAGFPVPEGWIIPARVFLEHLASWEIDANTPGSTVTDRIRDCEFSPELLRAIEALPDVPFAVRSSAASEDGASASYSGVFDTAMGIRGTPSILDAVRRVWSSAFTPEALAYHRKVCNTSEYPHMAVLIMPMIDAKAAGVAFTAHPVNGNPFVIAISAAYGLGTTVVDGKSPVDRYLLDWNTLSVIDMETGCKSTGEFLNGEGHTEKRTIEDAMQNHAALNESELMGLGQLVRDIDNLFSARIDVEFAVGPQGLVILQARPIIGLPPHFPDDPQIQDPSIYCGHQDSTEPLSPYSRSVLQVCSHPSVPPPPWPMEAEEPMFHHGRLFGRMVQDPELTQCPDTPWEDRGFVERMLSFDDPEAIFGNWYRYADMIYKEVIPSIRTRAERILRTSDDQLRLLNRDDFAEMVQDALELDLEAGVTYLSVSYPTYETLRRIELLIRDSLQLTWQESQQLALTMIQGAPKFTHLRDAEIEEAAHTGRTDDVIARWGYSYLRRDDLLDISTWRSWREDPTPLHIAMSNLRKTKPAQSITKRVQCAAEESEIRFREVLEAIRTRGRRGKQYGGVFAACVRASRRLFPLKDNRDLVLSHAQSAVRVILLEAGRRMVEHGVMTKADDVFLLRPEEISEAMAVENALLEMASIVRQRKEKQLELARYTLSLTPPGYIGDCGQMVHGAPASAGIAEGPVRIIKTDRPEEIAQLQPGEILWLCGAGKVGWTMYFPIIAGLVCDGNWLCHETNLCRELGIPAVVGNGNTPSVRSGDIIRIDGAKGTVTLVKRSTMSQ